VVVRSSEQPTEDDRGRRSKGRPLDRSRDAAILAATLEILSDYGYDRLTMDMVAARARAGKAALYRRWSSKAELVVDALAFEHSTLPPPDTGTLLGDLEQVLEHGQLRRQDYFGTSIIAGLATACSRDPKLARALHDRFLETGYGLLRLILERAVERGEVPRERDLEFIIEIIPALFFSRVLTSGKPPDATFAHRIVHEVIYPLAISPLPDSAAVGLSGPVTGPAPGSPPCGLIPFPR
jgi:AcrR family transcriptional regulator